VNPATFVNDIPTETAKAAFAGVSFTPEKRAEQTRDGYAEGLASDYLELLKLTEGKPGMAEILGVEFERYRAGYRARYLKKLGSDARCISWMITGPSNFPTHRNEKRNRIAHKRLEELLEFRTRALSAIRKTLCPELRPIMSGDGDAQQRLRADIEEREKHQAHMKLVNSTIRKHLKQDKATKLSALLAVGLSQSQAESALTPDCFGGIGFASFELTNNNANIKRMVGRLAVITRNQAAPVSERAGTFATVEDCPPENRVRLTFPGKPSEEIRTRLKRSGFRWTPSLGVWQAYRNSQTIQTAKEVAGV
jgi:hypothetical protein